MKSITKKISVASICALVLAALPAWGVAARQANQSILDPFLAKKVEAAAPGEEFVVFVHGDGVHAALEAVQESGMKRIDVFEKVGIAVAIGDVRAVHEARKMPGVTYLELDRPAQWFLDTSHQATRGNDGMAGFTVGSSIVPGVDGSGISVAIVDTGIDGTHPMFQTADGSKVVRNLKMVCFYLNNCTGSLGNAKDTYFVDASDTDSISAGGHGTHVAGIAAGVSVTDGTGKNLKGAAPGAKLIGISVGHVISVYAGTAGLNWVLEHHDAPCGTGVPTAQCPSIRVVNNSWGSTGEFDPRGAIARVENALVAEGVTVVFAAGNAGGDGSVNRTGSQSSNPTPGVISVANYNDLNTGTRDNKLARSSSRGQKGRPSTYPDVSAPGSNILSACRLYLAICSSGHEDPNYGEIGGTSMAAPHVAGNVAQLLQANPALTPAQIEDILEDTAYKFAAGSLYEPDPANGDNSTSFDKGHGLVDVKAALARVHNLSLDEAPPPAQTPPFSCQAGGAVLEDVEHDQWLVTVFPDSPDETRIPPDQPSLDIREARLDWNDTAQEMTFKIRVTDLGETNAATAPAAGYNFTFRHAGGFWEAEAFRGADGSTRFAFGEAFTVAVPGVTSATTRLHLIDVIGSFDASSDTVSIVVGNDDLAAVDVNPFDAGDEITDISAVTRAGQRVEVLTAGPSSDTADAPCNFVVGTGAVSPPTTPPPGIDATLDSITPAYAWSAGPFDRNPTLDEIVFGAGCAGPNDVNCDTTRVQVTIPATGATLTVTTTSGSTGADFDLYVYGPNGASVGSSAGATSDERVSLRINIGGVYTIAVYPYSADGASYSGRASIDVAQLPPTVTGAFDAEISNGGSHTWTGAAPLGDPAVGVTLTCAGAGTSTCDNERIKVNVPSGGGTLNVNVGLNNAADYYDLWVYVYDPYGVQIALLGSDTGGPTQSGSIPVFVSGIYRVAVKSRLAPPNAAYSGSVSLN